MSQYHKIQTVFKRDMANKGKTLLIGEFSLPEFEYLQHNMWDLTEKVDGTNIRIIVSPGKRVEYQGKTDGSQIPSTLVSVLRDKFDPMDEKLHEMFPTGAVLYGEGFGPKIQKGGGLYGPTQDFALFDVLVHSVTDNGEHDFWLRRDAVYDVASKLDLQSAPLIATCTIPDMVDFVRKGFKSQWGDFPAEGVVARPTTELFTRGGQRIITKLKLRDFPENQ